MAIILIIGSVVLFQVIIYLDATRYKIGQVGKRTFYNRPAGEIAATCGILWPLGIPLYLYSRKKLIEKARLYPVEVNRSRKISSIALLTFIPIWYGLQADYNSHHTKTMTVENDYGLSTANNKR